MAVVSFYPVDIEYRVYDNNTEVRLYGRRGDGRQICVVDKSYLPHFYVLLKDMSKLDEFGKKMQELKIPMKKGDAKVMRLEINVKRHNRKNREAIKVILHNPFEIYPIADAISQWPEVEEILETEIFFTRKYLIEREITPMNLMEAEGAYEQRNFKIPVFHATKIVQSIGETLLPRILFFDIKTHEASSKNPKEEQPIVVASLHGKDFERIITWKRFTTANANVDFVESEAELISRFERTIEEYNPDVIAGFLSEKFDLPYLIKRAQKYKIRLALGLDHSQIFPQVFSKTKRAQKIQIEGITHLDLSETIRRVFSRRSEFDFEDIDKIARELLSEETFASSGNDIESVANKSIEEARTYAKIYEKVFPFILELSKLLGLTINETVSLNMFQIPEWYLFKNAIQKNMLIPNKHPETQERLIEIDESVVAPQEMIYKNIFSLDLRNMSASLMAKYNLALDSKRCADCKGLTKDELWFCRNKKGLVPEMLDELITRKSRIKDILSGTDETKKTISLIARFEAVSILVHAFSRYIMSPKSRYYDEESARILESLVEETKKNITKKVQEKGFRIVYFDHDFLFLSFGTKRKDSAYIIAGILNELYYADVDVEGVFNSGFFTAHKKGKQFIKYALLLPDKTIRTKNFELVQRNAGNVARDSQDAILRIILEKGDIGSAVKYLQDMIAKLRNKEIPNKDVVMSNELQKEIDSYDTLWPYVVVAKKMSESGLDVGKGSLIQYIIMQGKEKTSDRARMPEEVPEGEYDAEYYINSQLIPAVSDIFEAFGLEKDSLVKVKEQTKLDGFFGQ